MIKTINIGKIKVGEGNKTYVIAEAGSNHDKKFTQAKKLIDIAAKAQADAIKFQLFKAENFYPKGSEFYNLLKNSELPYEWVEKLFKYSKDKNIQFLATPTDYESIDLLNKLGVPAFKWASSEIVNLPLLRYAASKNKTIILSTGMSNIADIYEAIDVINSTGNNKIIIMQCTSLYPSPFKNVNLNAMRTLKETFGYPVGFSDHTLGILMPPVAVAFGACIIEKHFTISRKLKGADHGYAVEPEELSQMIRNIRSIEDSLGSFKKVMINEERKYARRESIYAIIDLKKNEEITLSKIIVKRPAKGIEPRYQNKITGLKAKVNIKAGSPITWDNLNY